MVKKISLNNEFGENIVTRNSIAVFFKEKINSLKDDEIILNFIDIKFISRSCAAEYIKLKNESNKSIIEKNISEEVRSMFDLVIKQLRGVNFSFTKENPIIY